MATYSELPIASGTATSTAFGTSTTLYTVPAGRRCEATVTFSSDDATNTIELRTSGGTTLLSESVLQVTPIIFVEKFHLDEGQDIRLTGVALKSVIAFINFIEYTKP